MASVAEPEVGCLWEAGEGMGNMRRLSEWGQCGQLLVMLFFSLTTENKDVIHVYGHYPFINELFEYVIHHHLKGGQAIC